MSVRTWLEYTEKLRRVAEEAGVMDISALSFSRQVLLIQEVDKVHVVKKLLDTYIPNNAFTVRVNRGYLDFPYDILVYESSGKYWINVTEENAKCLKETMSEEEKEIYADYNIFGAG